MHPCLGLQRFERYFGSSPTNQSSSLSTVNSWLAAMSSSLRSWRRTSALWTVSGMTVGYDFLLIKYYLGIFPGRGQVIWRDWYTQERVNASIGTNTTLDAPLGHINVHIRDGAALLLHSSPAYTVEETRQGPFSLLVSLSSAGEAFGTAFLDDGVSFPPGPSTTVTFNVRTAS